MVVLVTGFEPNDDGINASEVVVKSLAENLPLELTECSDLLRFEVMPGNTNFLEDALKEAFQRHAPNFCLFTGQAPGRNKITIERIATNLKDFRTPDKPKFSNSPFMPLEMTRIALSLIIKTILKN